MSLPVFRAVFNEDDPDQGVKSIILTDKPIFKFITMSETKKQSGYQKLKAELEAANQKIKEQEKLIEAIDLEFRLCQSELTSLKNLPDQAERV